MKKTGLLAIEQEAAQANVAARSGQTLPRTPIGKPFTPLPHFALDLGTGKALVLLMQDPNSGVMMRIISEGYVGTVRCRTRGVR
jgi:hypothetical protein